MVPVPEVQQFVNHSDIAITQVHDQIFTENMIQILIA